jgi:hypothetical protein
LIFVNYDIGTKIFYVHIVLFIIFHVVMCLVTTCILSYVPLLS